MEIMQRIDLTVDLLALAAVVVGITLLWFIYRAVGGIRDGVLRLVQHIETSTARVEAARDNIGRLTEEIHRREIAVLEQRLKALEERASGAPPKP
jgi:hypothetical protein